MRVTTTAYGPARSPPTRPPGLSVTRPTNEPTVAATGSCAPSENCGAAEAAAKVRTADALTRQRPPGTAPISTPRVGMEGWSACPGAAVRARACAGASSTRAPREGGGAGLRLVRKR
jgi:hypothetical protein